MKSQVSFLSIVSLLLFLSITACGQGSVNEIATPQVDTVFSTTVVASSESRATPTDPTAPKTLATVTPGALTPSEGDLLYNEETLTYWHTRFPDSTRNIYEIGFLPYLDPAEKEALANVQLQFPLTAGEPYEDDPLAFYAFSDASIIVMPILSLKFLDDLSTAYAWLWHNGYELETVTDYVAMLKYQPETFRAGRFPPPMTALQIPEDALSDPEVDALALAFFNEARAFILAHELGHIRHNHSGNKSVPANESQRLEKEADEFGLDLMTRTATQPMGAYLYFFTRAHWEMNLGDFSNDSKAWEAHLTEATHPLTASRMTAMALQLRESAPLIATGKPNPATEMEATLFIADGMAKIAEMLEDPEIAHSIRLKGKATNAAFLAPRYPGARPCDAVSITVQPDAMAFDGLYVADYVRSLPGEDSEILPMCLQFNRNGNHVVGYFIFELGEGEITGQVVGENLVFKWQWGSFNGKGVLVADDGGDAINGEWGYDQEAQGGGQWIGRRS